MIAQNREEMTGFQLIGHVLARDRIQNWAVSGRTEVDLLVGFVGLESFGNSYIGRTDAG
jgi:hypothetical protein